MADPILMRHGSLDAHEESVPSFGDTFDATGVRLSAVPRHLFEVNFQSAQDCITITTGNLSGYAAYDTDKREQHHVASFTAAFHPAGSKTYVRSDSLDGGFFSLSINKSFRDSFAEETGNRHLAGDLRIVDNLRLSAVQPILQSLRHFFAPDTVRSKMAAEALGLTVLSNTLLQIDKPAPGPTARTLSDQALSRVFELIESDLTQDLGLSELAGAAELSAFHFARSFKAATGLPPHQYVMERRLARAQELLEGSHALAEIAYAVGFSSQSHMTDVFRKKLGVTPGKYRREVET